MGNEIKDWDWRLGIIDWNLGLGNWRFGIGIGTGE